MSFYPNCEFEVEVRVDGGPSKIIAVSALGDRDARSKAHKRARRKHPAPAVIEILDCTKKAEQLTMGGVLGE